MFSTLATINNNKERIVKLLVKRIRGDGHAVIECKDDADTQIVAAALGLTWQKQEVNAVTDDTEKLVLLLYYWNFEIGNIILQSMSTNKENTSEIK